MTARCVRLFMAEKNIQRAHRILVTKIMPLLERHPICIQVKRRCEREEGRFNKNDGQIRRELMRAAYDIIARIKKAALDLKGSSTIQRALCILVSMLKFRCETENATKLPSTESPTGSEYFCNHCDAPMWQHRPHVLPSYAYGINTAIENLCHAVVAAGSGKLLDEFVEIADTKEYVPSRRYQCIECNHIHIIDPEQDVDETLRLWHCPRCGNNSDDLFPLDHAERTVPFIKRFKFAYSMRVDAPVHEQPLNDQKRQLKDAYKLLCTFEWAYNKDRDFLRDKELRYNKSKACWRSGRLIEVHSFRIDVMLIKADVVITDKKSQNKKKQQPLFITPEMIRSALLCVMNGLNIMLDETTGQDSLYPCSISLIAERRNAEANSNARILLRIVWQRGIYETLTLHTFQTSPGASNTIGDFADTLYKNAGSFIKVDPSLAKGAYASKYVERLGFIGALKKIFIEQKDTHWVKLKSHSIDLSGASEALLRKICKQLDELDTIDWQFP